MQQVAMNIDVEVKTQKCSKCGEVKGVEEFPARKSRRSGLNSWCKECHRYYRENDYKPTLMLSSIHVEEAKRLKLQGRNQKWLTKYFECGDLQFRITEVPSKPRNIPNPAFRSHSTGEASRAVSSAIRKGILTRPKRCSVCIERNEEWDKGQPIYAHHTDYNKLINVMWLCPHHHGEWHRFNKTIPKRYHNTFQGISLLDAQKVKTVHIARGGIVVKNVADLILAKTGSKSISQVCGIAD